MKDSAKSTMPKPKPHCDDLDLLRRFLDEQLSAEDESRVSEHIGACVRCRKQLESWLHDKPGWQNLKAELAEFDPESNPKVSDFGGVNASDASLTSVQNLLAPTDDPAMLGRLGKYEICGIIGRGSAGIVCKAHDSGLNRFVAIKILSPAIAHNAMARKRFEREGRAIAAVINSNVIQVHGVDEFQGTPYIVMQYLPAGSLQKRLDEKGCLTTTEVCRIGLQIARGLEAAHGQGIVHRDIKPANVLLEDGLDRAIVSDFGLARVADEATMTHTGSIAGTPQYMSPEQAQGKSLDARSDLFSLGSVMYTCCTGHSPFRGETLMGVIHNVCHANPAQVRDVNPEIADWLATFVNKLLSKDKEERFESASEVAALLADELAHLQMPTSVACPNRDWLVEQHQDGTSRRRLLMGILTSVVIVLISFQLLWSDLFFKKGNSPRDLLANSYGIQPTEQELNFFKAKAAYDLAYETHLSEAALRGDMIQSIDRHREAIQLGYDKSKSNYLLARAHAFEGNTELAFKYLQKAINAGFHDLKSLQSDSELNSIRRGKRFQAVTNEVRELANRWAKADKVFFDLDFATAEKCFRDWLEICPNDDLAKTLLGASLTEQGKTREAWEWNEKARRTVRYAKFANYNQGCVALQEGDVDKAFAYLNYAVETGFTDADHTENDKMLVELRNDPRFKALLNRLRDLQEQ